MNIEDFRSLCLIKYNSYTDFWAGDVQEYIMMFEHKPTGRFFGAPKTDTTGYVRGTRGSVWKDQHLTYIAEAKTYDLLVVEFERETVFNGWLFQEVQREDDEKPPIMLFYRDKKHGGGRINNGKVPK